MRSTFVFIALALLSTSCSRKPQATYSDENNATASAPAAEAELAQAGLTQPAGAEPSSTGVSAAQAPMLAYRYKFGLSLPLKNVERVRAAHEAACTKAGFQLCQVVSTYASVEGDNGSATLILRAAPTWLQGFRSQLTSDAENAGGKVKTKEVTSEDLSREIVDTAAQLKAKTTLRDRLQALLASRPGKVSDLLEVERELGRVQGEIDSNQSQLAVMRSRVATTEVTISYQSTAVLGSASAWNPLGKALVDFLAIVAFSLAALVRFVAWLLPWALVAGGLYWVFRKRIAKVRLPFRKKPSVPS